MNENDAEMAQVRVQKYLADCGFCSRRAAELMMAEGRVAINGELAQLGQKVLPGEDSVTVDGRQIRPPRNQRHVVLMMHKPKGYLCTNHDPHGEKTVFELVPQPWSKERLFCAGRLDKDSEGLLILTNDGELANRITHPSGGVIKRYRVRVHRAFDPEIVPKMLRGITREGERLYAQKVIPATTGQDAEYRLEIHLSQGRKREIRRLLEAFGYYVKRLERFQMGKLVLKGVGPGSLRPLKPHEIEWLFKEPTPEPRP